jgi:hypothetical protein
MIGNFSENAIEQVLDFTTCQRPDGSTYGTSGTCRKGVEITRMSTGYFRVTDANGTPVGSIMAQDSLLGGGGIREAGKQSRYTVTVGNQSRENMTLAAAKAQAKDWLGEKTSGTAKAQVKGGLSAKGKAKRLENAKERYDETVSRFNAGVRQWNSIPKEQRGRYANLKKQLDFLKNKVAEQKALIEAIEAAPVAD